MNCNKVSHLLSAYIDGELLGYEHRLIHQHVQRCSECSAEYEELLQMKRLLSAMRVCEPGKNLAANIVQRVTARESRTAAASLGAWRTSFPSFSARPLAFSPIVGLGVGLTLVGFCFWARPASPTNAAAGRHSQIEFEPAIVSRDEPPRQFGELTNGLMREGAPHPVSFDPRYTDDLSDFPLAARRSPRMRRSIMTTSYLR